MFVTVFWPCFLSASRCFSSVPLFVTWKNAGCTKRFLFYFVSLQKIGKDLILYIPGRKVKENEGKRKKKLTISLANDHVTTNFEGNVAISCRRFTKKIQHLYSFILTVEDVINTTSKAVFACSECFRHRWFRKIASVEVSMSQQGRFSWRLFKYTHNITIVNEPACIVIKT